MRRLIASIRHACSGFGFALRHERNMKIHAVTAVLALLLCAALRVNRFELLFVLLAISLVLSAELVNTAIEKWIDATVERPHPLAKAAKDCAAAAVLVSGIFAACAGVLVFGAKLVGG